MNSTAMSHVSVYVSPHDSHLVKCRYHLEEADDPLAGAIVMVVVPDDANETDNVFQFRSNFNGLELRQLPTWLF